jgi:excisionase family DNA binding protein
MSPSDEDLGRAYSYREVARRLDVSYSTVRRLVADGALPAIRVCGLPRVTHQALLGFLAAQAPPMPIQAAARVRRRAAY